MPIKWYQKVIIKNKKGIIKTTIISIIFTIIFSLWYFKSSNQFHWQSITPVSVPTISSRLFYSALVFVTLGAFLIFIRFYQFLHILLVKFLGSWELYRFAKKIIWNVLIFLMCFYIVPKIVGLLNAIASLFYNLWFLILYLSPTIGIFLSVFFISLIVYHNQWLKNFDLKINNKFK